MLVSQFKYIHAYVSHLVHFLTASIDTERELYTSSLGFSFVPAGTESKIGILRRKRDMEQPTTPNLLPTRQRNMGVISPRIKNYLRGLRQNRDQRRLIHTVVGVTLGIVAVVIIICFIIFIYVPNKDYVSFIFVISALHIRNNCSLITNANCFIR